MNKRKIIDLKRQRRHRRVRSKISGTSVKPRLSVYRSLKYIYAQLIDDDKRRVVASSTDLKLKNVKAAVDSKLKAKLARAWAVGLELARKAKEAGCQAAVFDRGSYKYHGRVKALAEGARSGGLKF